MPKRIPTMPVSSRKGPPRLKSRASPYPSQARSAELRCKAWRDLRALKLQQDPLCFDCEGRGRVTAAQVVHHIKRRQDHPESMFDLGDLMSLCKSCHRIRTNRGE